MVSLAGLSAVQPGYLQADSTSQQTRLRKAQADQADIEMAGNTAFGNTLKAFQSQVPGAQAMPGAQGAQMAQGPQAPSPGQPSVPMRPPMPMQGNMPQGGQSPAGSSPMAPQGMPQQGQPQMPPQGPQGGGQPPMQGGGMPGGQGQLDWRVIMGKVAQANPNAPPAVIASAVTKFLPLMNQQAQMEWKNVQMAMMAQRTQQGQERVEQGDRRLDQGDTRLGQGQEKVDVSKAGEERRTTQGDRRLDQGDTRLQQGDRRLDQGDTREQRLAAGAAIRQDQGWQNLEIKKQNLARQITQGNDRQKLSEWRATVDAQHKRATEIIQSKQAMMPDDERKALLKEENDNYRADLEQMRNGIGRTTPDANKPDPAGKTPDRLPQGTPPGLPQGAKQAPDGKYYVPDPNRPGKYLEVVQ